MKNVKSKLVQKDNNQILSNTKKSANCRISEEKSIRPEKKEVVNKFHYIAEIAQNLADEFDGEIVLVEGGDK